MNNLRKVITITFILMIFLSSCAQPTKAPTSEVSPTEPSTEVEEQKPTSLPTEAESEGEETEAGPEAILRIGWTSEIDTLNPLTTYSTEATEVLQLIYDKLLGFSYEFIPQPELAEEFSYSEDGLSITFKLRDNAVWHDGEPLTADDVVFTYTFIRDNEIGGYAKWLTHLESATADDPSTVTLKFDLPQAFNPAVSVPILPKHVWGEMSVEDVEVFANDNPVGSGPYRFVEWQEGSQLTLERNPDFWGSQPAPSKVIYVLYGNEDVMAQALKGGEIDIITEVPPTIWDGLTDVENVKAVSLPSFSFHHIGMNVYENEASLGNPALLDKEVRHALNYAIDRNQLVQIALAGHGRPGGSILPIGITEWYLEIPEDLKMDADPEQAKAILEAAGYIDSDGDGVREDADGNPLEFRIIAIEATAVDVRAAQLFRDSAAEVGIKLDLQTMDENTLGDIVYNVDAPDWDLFVWGWDSEVPDPNYMLAVPLCSQIDGDNDVFYCNDEYDQMYDEQTVTIDSDARKAIVDDMQKIFYDDSAYIVMWYQDKLQAYRTDTWEGWTEIPGGLIYNITRLNYLDITPAE